MSPVRPGTQILLRDTPTPRGAPTDTGVWFITGVAERGRRGIPELIRSMDEFKKKAGGRMSTSVLYDAVETYFREGGTKLYFSRVQNADAIKATVNVLDGSAGVALIVAARSAGTWGNGLNVAVTAGGTAGTFILTITHDTDTNILEVSPELADTAAAVAWGTSSEYVTITQGASVLDPAVATYNLATGTEGTASVEADWTTALAAFSADLGPGQVSAPGRTTTAANQALLEHARTTNRFALLDGADTPTAATLKTEGTTLRAHAGARHGMLLAPWVKIPGLTPNTTRTVPPSAYAAGLIGRLESRGESPNVAAAGVNGQAQYVLDVTQTFTDANADDLYLNGSVNLTKLVYGGIRMYGWRTLAHPQNLPAWVNAGNSRLYMAIAAKADAIAESFVLQQIDGRGLKIKEFEGALRGMLSPYYSAGSLYGDTPAEAFNVETGPSVNTDLTIANGELKAVLALRMSPHAELVTVEIVKVGVTEPVA